MLESIIKEDILTEVNRVDLNMNANVVASDGKSVENRKMNTVFNEDGQLNRVEKQELRRNASVDLTNKEIKHYSQMEGGEAFLDKYANAVNIKDQSEREIARKKLALDFFVGNDPYNDVANEIKADLRRFGVNSEELENRLEQNRLNYHRPKVTINSEFIPGNINTALPARMHVNKDQDGNITSLTLYEGDEGLNNEDAAPTRVLDKEGEYFVDKDGKYYRFNEESSVLSDVTIAVNAQKAAAEQKEEKKIDEKKEEPPKFSDIMAKNNSVVIDETGSKQRLTSAEQWTTNLKIPKNTEYNENGVPEKLAIELPSDYGAKGPDGVAQKRYQTLQLVDAENNIYSDRAGIRQFKLEFGEDGISLVQQNIDDKKVKDFLNQNTEQVSETAKEAGLNEVQKKMEITAEEESEDIMSQLSDRNNSWETYTQIGTDIGHVTGSHGLLEKLVDEQDVTGIKTFNDLKPAIEGLMARVPESLYDTPEYKAVQEAIDKLAEEPDANIKHSWFRQIGGDTDIRKLDRALMNLAKTHLAGTIQGANHANNAYLVGGNGSVVIAPDREQGVFDTDAKFTINGNVYYLYEERSLIDRTIDFQDVVEHKDDDHRDSLSLIRNEITGNDRHGEIKFNAERAAENGQLYFKNHDTGEKFEIILENNNAYLMGKDNVKVLLEDILNGRAQMPDQVV